MSPGLIRRLVPLALAVALVAPPALAAAPAPQLRAGRNLFGQYCAACHAITAAGRPAAVIGAGPDRAQTVQRALAPSLYGVGASAADFELTTGYMPLAHVGTEPHRRRVAFSETQVRRLVAYVASLGRGPAIPTPQPASGNVSSGMQLFTDHCAGCHQIATVGGYVSGAVAPSLGAATDTQIAEAVRLGPYVMPRFSARAISQGQLDSIIAYVRYARHPDDRGGLPIGHLGPVPEGLVAWLIAAGVLIGVCVVIGTRLPRAR
jgi:ubiquinol-cytochrome c reductase cytochrome c subunit